MDPDLETRLDKYFELSSRLAHVGSKQLDKLLGGKGTTGGWGGTHVVKLGASKVFVKKIPVTDLEYDNLFSTENLYCLPTYYN